MQALRSGLAILSAVLLGGCLASMPNTVSRHAPPVGSDRLMSPADHNFQRGSREAGDPVRRGETSERFELRDGDCGGSDCANPRARAEIQLDTDAHPAEFGKDIWYGYSFYNATVPSFEKENSLRLVFGQWTMGGTNKPIFRFIQLGKGEADFSKCDPTTCNTRNPNAGDLAVQLEDIATARNWGDKQNNGYVCRLFDLQENQGVWKDIMVNTNFSAGHDGYLRIWVDQRLVCNYAGPLVSATSITSGMAPKHRRGIYSSWTKRWQKAEGGRAKPRLIVYYDEFRTGNQMSDVDIRQLAAASVPAID